jgi:TPR repeat protein
LKKAVELVFSNAMNRLAYCYILGKGMYQNTTKAVEFYENTAKLNDSTAIFFLGRCYEGGNCFPKYEEKGIGLITKAV